MPAKLAEAVDSILAEGGLGRNDIAGFCCHPGGAKVVDAIKAELKMPNLQVKLNPVTSATRIPQW